MVPNEAILTDADNEALESAFSNPNKMGASARRLQVITCFSTLFAKWEFQESGLLIQLFPRSGVADEWFEGRWVAEPKKGGRYVGGRGEIKHPSVSFPSSFRKTIQDLVDVIWDGDAKLDYVDEFGSYCLLFENLKHSESLMRPGGLIDSLLEELDKVLED